MYISSDYFLDKNMIWYLVKPNYMHQQTNKETQESINFSKNNKYETHRDGTPKILMNHKRGRNLKSNIQLEQKGLYSKSQVSSAEVHGNKKSSVSLGKKL